MTIAPINPPADEDLPTDVEELRRLANGGDTRAMERLGMACLIGEQIERDVERGRYWLEKAALHGEARAAYALGQIYDDGMLVPHDPKKAFAYYYEASAGGYAPAMTNLGMLYIQGDGTEPDVAEALKWISRAAGLGDPVGIYDLADMYVRGEGVEPDVRRAVELYGSVADREPDAWVRLSDIHHDGVGGLPVDDALAHECLEKGVAGGSNEASYQVGCCLLKGARNYPVDPVKGEEMLLKAARAGYLEAQFLLSYLYEEGDVLERDMEKALFWCRACARAGHPQGLYNLGVTYYMGEDLPEDYAMARHCFEAALKAGEWSSLFYLGKIAWENSDLPDGDAPDETIRCWREGARHGAVLCMTGLGRLLYLDGQDDREKAREGVRWLKRAARAEDAEACYFLGDALSEGIGIRKNYKQAHMMFEKAASLGFNDALVALGYDLMMGVGVDVDRRAGFECFRRAVELGVEGAAINMGIACRKGDGIPVDYDLARECFEKALSEGDTDGAVALASLYIEGHGVKKNFKKAAALLEPLIDESNDALGDLGVLTYRGGTDDLGHYMEPDREKGLAMIEHAVAAADPLEAGDAKVFLAGLILEGTSSLGLEDARRMLIEAKEARVDRIDEASALLREVNRRIRREKAKMASH